MDAALSRDGPLRTGAPPLRAGDPPLRTGAPPLRTGDPPLRTGDPPLRTLFDIVDDSQITTSSKFDTSGDRAKDHVTTIASKFRQPEQGSALSRTEISTSGTNNHTRTPVATTSLRRRSCTHDPSFSLESQRDNPFEILTCRNAVLTAGLSDDNLHTR